MLQRQLVLLQLLDRADKGQTLFAIARLLFAVISGVALAPALTCHGGTAVLSRRYILDFGSVVLWSLSCVLELLSYGFVLFILSIFL